MQNETSGAIAAVVSWAGILNHSLHPHGPWTCQLLSAVSMPDTIHRKTLPGHRSRDLALRSRCGAAAQALARFGGLVSEVLPGSGVGFHR